MQVLGKPPQVHTPLAVISASRHRPVVRLAHSRTTTICWLACDGAHVCVAGQRMQPQAQHSTAHSNKAHTSTSAQHTQWQGTHVCGECGKDTSATPLVAAGPTAAHFQHYTHCGDTVTRHTHTHTLCFAQSPIKSLCRPHVCVDTVTRGGGGETCLHLSPAP